MGTRPRLEAPYKQVQFAADTSRRKSVDNPENTTNREALKNNVQVKTEPLYYGSDNRIKFSPEQRTTFCNIVTSVGKERCWQTIFELLCMSFSKPVPEDCDQNVCPDDDLIENLRQFYLKELDPHRLIGPFTPKEDRQLLMLFRCWPNIWKNIARHMPGRTASGVEKRVKLLDSFQSVLQSVPGKSTAFSLVIIPKSGSVPKKDMAPRNGFITNSYGRRTDKKDKMALPAREFSLNCLVVGSRSELFLLPCKETALWCDHSKFPHKSFTYDPDKPDDQFTNYLKLSMCNELRKKCHILDPSFNFNEILYDGDGIHSLMQKAASSWFVIPSSFVNGSNTQMVLTYTIYYDE